MVLGAILAPFSRLLTTSIFVFPKLGLFHTIINPPQKPPASLPLLHSPSLPPSRAMSPLELTSYSLLSLIFLYFIYSLLLRRQKPLPPGPKPWPIVGNLPHLGAMPHQGLAALARKYGPLMHLRLGYVHVVVAASASTAAQFLKTHDANFSSRPPNSGAKHIAYNYQDLVFAPYGSRWRLLRKICSVHLFSAKALDDFRCVRQEEVGILTKALANAGKTKKPVQVGQLLNVCATNALARVMLGRRVFGDGTGTGDAKSDEFKEMVVELMVLAGVFNIGDFVPALEWLDLQGIAAKMKKLHNRFDKFLGSILEEHKVKTHVGGDKQQHTDLLSILLSLKEDFDGEGGKLTDTEIKALLLDLFTAGTDTSSSTTEWALAELIRHPKILAQVQQELDSVVGRDRLISEQDLPQLTYFQAVIKEVFRLHPSTPLSLPRMAAESCEINNYYIPKGSTILINVWAISRDPEVWTDPLEFRPSRFLPGGERPNVDIKGNDFEVIPFGAGRRICAGLSLGLRMVQLLTATLVHAFDWELADGQVPEKLNMDEAYGLTLQRKVPLMVQPRPRLAAGAY
ncbi:cytochrome P450 [Ancistrocladus abbreviatus]